MKNDKKKMVLLLVVTLVICITACVFVLISFSRREPYDPSATKYGELTDVADETVLSEKELYDATEHDDSDLWKDEYEDEFVPDDGIDCYYKNMEIVFNYIPIGVVKTLRLETSEYLSLNGYSKATELEILEDTIIGDRSNVTFSCTMLEYPDKTLVVNYNTTRKTVEFDVK